MELSSSQKLRGIVLGLIVGTLAVYWPVVDFDFVNFDDDQYVSANPIVLRGLTWEGVGWAFTTHHASNWHPLTWLSHMLDTTLFGTGPAGPHLVNVLLHVVNALLVFALFQRMTGAVWRSGILAAVFAWHPLHVESVAWVSERKDVLSMLFGLLALLAYHRYATTDGRRWRWYWLSVMAFGLSLLAKPMLVTLPCVLLLLDFWPLGRVPVGGPSRPEPGSARCFSSSPSRRIRWRDLLAEKLPFLLGTIGLSIVTVQAQKAGGALVGVGLFSIPDRVANAVFAYAGYLGKTIWPADLICPYIERRWTAASFALALGGLLAVTTLVVICRARRYLTVGWCWYLGTLVPVIGLVQVGSQYMADRYTYFPLLGIFVMVLWAGAEFAARSRLASGFANGAVVVVLAGCLILTALQVRHWKNSESLFSHTLQVEPRNFLAEEALGHFLMVQGNLPEAIAHLSNAVALAPREPGPMCNLGQSLYRAGRANEALGWFQSNLVRNPMHPATLSAMADLLANQGRTAEALATYEQRLQLTPKLGADHAGMAALLARVGRTNEAEAHFRTVLRLEPSSSLAYYNLAIFLGSQQRSDEADEYFVKAAGMEPALFQVHTQWAAHLLRSARPAQALGVLQRALPRFPESPPLLDLLARLLAAHPDDRLRNGGQAIMLAEKASQLTEQRDPRHLDTLAAAQAEAGLFPAAVATLERALELVAGERAARLRAGLQSRLELYRRMTPFRDAGDWLVGN